MLELGWRRRRWSLPVGSIRMCASAPSHGRLRARAVRRLGKWSRPRATAFWNSPDVALEAVGALQVEVLQGLAGPEPGGADPAPAGVRTGRDLTVQACGELLFEGPRQGSGARAASWSRASLSEGAFRGSGRVGPLAADIPRAARAGLGSHRARLPAAAEGRAGSGRTDCLAQHGHESRRSARRRLRDLVTGPLRWSSPYEGAG